MCILFFAAVVSFFLLAFFFFLACSQWSQIGCLLHFHTWCGLGANLECRSEIWYTRLAENTGRKNSPCSHHRMTVGLYLYNKGMYRQLGKNVKRQYLRHVSSHYGELRPTNGWHRLASLGLPANFNGFRVLVLLLQRAPCGLRGRK